MSALICETPDGCTCGAPATTPRGMHRDYCAVRHPAPTTRTPEESPDE